jgi:hypothetical protein
MLKCLNKDCGREFLYAAKKSVTTEPKQNQFESVEAHICPFCGDLNIAEVEKTEPRIESIISVNIPEADEWIKKGYEVKDTYATKVTLIKKAKETKK